MKEIQISTGNFWVPNFGGKPRDWPHIIKAFSGIL
jgi:hypothetical protein